ncbi:hypothetical protein IG631_19643 [Alternaria alternata]|nr:hypothetical protein IG631_19643 [Alternaria alternata]
MASLVRWNAHRYRLGQTFSVSPSEDHGLCMKYKMRLVKWLPSSGARRLLIALKNSSRGISKARISVGTRTSDGGNTEIRVNALDEGILSAKK